MIEDSELLRRYARSNSEEAFAELVQRHLNLVYSAALRQVNGDTHLAQDVAQMVFSDLARKASTLLDRQILTGWLYTSTYYAAANAVRTECRRRTHEEEANAMHEFLQSSAPELDWAKLGPVLDRVMHELNESDRDVLLMRYFENRRLGDIGEKLGLSEDAVRKRVERALDKLRAFLFKRGITTTATLAAVISGNAVQMAPAGLTATVTSVSLAGAATASATGLTALKLMAISKLKIGFISAIVVAGVAVPLMIQHQAQIGLREKNESLERQAARLQSDNASLSNQIVSANNARLFSNEQLSELLKLRGEAGRLRQQIKQLDQLRAENQRLRAQLGAKDNSALTASTISQPPFQVRLVVDAQDENAEAITNRANIADANAAQEMLYVQKAALIDSTAIRSADVVSDPSSGASQINLVLTDQGRELFAKVTKENINKRLAIVMGGQSYLAPTVRSEITDGRIQLSGAFTEEQARELAAKINEAVASH